MCGACYAPHGDATITSATVRDGRARCGTIDRTMTGDLKLRVGRAITPEQFELLSDEQLARLLPRSVREFFPGKDFCADGTFYLHDGTVWSFYKGGYLDE
jgi:hypothetical protein